MPTPLPSTDGRRRPNRHARASLLDQHSDRSTVRVVLMTPGADQRDQNSALSRVAMEHRGEVRLRMAISVSAGKRVIGGVKMHSLWWRLGESATFVCPSPESAESVIESMYAHALAFHGARIE